MDPAEWFASLVRQPIESTHLDVFAGLIGVCFEPDNSVAEVAQRLDELAASVEPSFDSVMSLFSKGQFSGNSADYADPRNSYLHQVVRRGLGIPITLSVCAMEIGRRVGVPIYGVGLPGHFMVVCDGRYGDPFRGGALIDAHQLEEWWRRSSGSSAAFDRRFLSPSPPRAIVLRMLNNLTQTFVTRNDGAALAVLARLRGCFEELESERGEHARWMRHWN